MPLSPALNLAWPEVGCDCGMRYMGLRHQRKSITPNIFSLENDLSLLIKFPDQFLKLIGSIVPQTRLLYLGYFSTFDFPGHSLIVPGGLGKLLGPSNPEPEPSFHARSLIREIAAAVAWVTLTRMMGGQMCSGCQGASGSPHSPGCRTSSSHRERKERGRQVFCSQ